MLYYEVWVADRRYQGSEALTYQSEYQLDSGAFITVPLRDRIVPAIVVKKVGAPSFVCQKIVSVRDLPPLPENLIKLLSWLKDYYPAPIGPLAQLFLPPKLSDSVKVSSSPSEVKASNRIPLNDEQSKAVQLVEGTGSYLLHGRTGSGKTHVYAALAQKTMSEGRSVIILNPEIGLTAQLTKTLEKLIGTAPVLLHSRLTDKQRTENWIQLIAGESPQLVVGTRSALFAPLNNVGLIVIDESHENAYKQDSQPRYLATRVAAALAKLHDARLVLGSATPSLIDYFLAEQKSRPIVRLNKLAMTQISDIKLKIVDLKDRSQFNKSSYLSDSLIKTVESSLKNSEQVMLYLNRRGTSRLSLCKNCGWRALCLNCDLPLVYHGDKHELICHTCGKKQPAKNSCPECGSQDIVFRAAGTKAIESEAKRLFPRARVRRFDTDNAKAESLEQNYESVKSGLVDIIIGTQLIAKGLDLPKLTTLGVILADSSLAIPDYGSDERTYQLIRQVVGRVGRGHKSHATAIIQTYNPSNKTIVSAVREEDDWKNFYRQELLERKKFNFPPYCYLAKISCKRASATNAEKASLKLAKKLKINIPDLIIEGPSPAFREKIGTKYCWQIVLKSKNRNLLIKASKNIPGNFTFDLEPTNLL